MASPRGGQASLFKQRKEFPHCLSFAGVPEMLQNLGCWAREAEAEQGRGRAGAQHREPRSALREGRWLLARRAWGHPRNQGDIPPVHCRYSWGISLVSTLFCACGMIPGNGARVRARPAELGSEIHPHRGFGTSWVSFDGSRGRNHHGQLHQHLPGFLSKPQPPGPLSSLTALC